MGYPVEQQKYQSIGNLVLTFDESGTPTGYRHQLDIDTAVATTTYEHRRRAFPARGLLVAGRPGHRRAAHRLTRGAAVLFRPVARRSQPGALELRDRLLPDGRLRGRRPGDARQVGRLPGRCWTAALRHAAQGDSRGRPHRASRTIGSSCATPTRSRCWSSAATNFVSYKDVSGDPDARVECGDRGGVRQVVRRDQGRAYGGAPAAVPPRRDRSRDLAGFGPARPTSD